MKGVELGRSIGSVATAPAMGVGRMGGFNMEGPRMAMSVAARAYAKDFAPIQIPKPIPSFTPRSGVFSVPDYVQLESIGQKTTIIDQVNLNNPNIHIERKPGFFINQTLVNKEVVSYKPRFKVEDVVKEAERIVSQAQQRPKVAVTTRVEAFTPAVSSRAEYSHRVYRSSVVARRLAASYLNSSTGSELRAQVQSRPEVSFASAKSDLASAQKNETAHPQPKPQTEDVEEEVEELVQEQKQRENIKEDEEVLELKRVYLEDEEVSGVRRIEVKEAIKKAFYEAVKAGLKIITGELVAKFLPQDHEGNRSQIVKKQGPDGTNLAVVQQVSIAGEFYTEDQAQLVLDKILEQNKPVRLGKDSEQGKRVTLEDVKKVVRPKRISIPVWEFVTRVVKKRQKRGYVVKYEPKQILEGADYGI